MFWIKRDRLRVENESIIIRPIYFIEQLDRCHHVPDGRLVNIVEHGKIAFAVNGVENAVHRRTIAIVLKAEIILVFRHGVEEFLHLYAGNCSLGRGNRVLDIQVECACISILLCVALAVREIEPASIQVGVLGFSSIKDGEVTVPATVHHFEPPVIVPHLAVFEELLLFCRQRISGAIAQREFLLYSPLILRASGIARVAILVRSANIALDTQRIQ